MEAKSKEKFVLSHDALSKANIGLWAIEVVEGEAPRMYADATMCRLLGIKEGLDPERIYRAWYDNIDPDHYDMVTDAVNRMAAGSHAEVQYPWHHPTEGEIFVRCGGMRNMEYTRGLRFEGCHQDVTELIHIQKQAALAELENKFLEKMIKSIPSPFFIRTADDLCYRLCNQAFAELHGRSPEDICGLKNEDLFPPDHAALFAVHDRETMSAPGIHYFPCHGSGMNTRLYDKWQTCIDGGDGHRYIIGSLSDITDFKRAEQARSEFFAKVSHDIRTPLNAVIGYSQMLSAGVEDPVERREYLDSISFSAESLLDLITDVLDISKLGSDKFVFIAERCEFGELVRKVLRSVTPHATSRGVKLVAKTAGLPVVSLDVRRIRQILFNLVGNAVKFTEKGTVTVEASFERTDAGKGRLVFSVRDTGIGISADDLQHIFQPFMQAGNNTQQRGTGLGLSICKQLIEKMGGSITVASQLGEGSVFTVTLPEIGCCDGAAEVAAPKSIDPLEVDHSMDTLRLLLVDDIKMNLSVLKSMLRRMGVVNVKTAGDGVEAMEMLKAEPDGFDAVLTDMWMPRCDGMGLLREIRAFAPTEKLPVYAVTADVECTGGDRSRFDGVLLKPLTIESLREFIRGIGK